jgi:hypothetical protein
MCVDCWETYGKPRLINDKIREAVSLMHRIYTGWECDGTWLHAAPHEPPWYWYQYYDGNMGGGNLHVIIDDWNIDDEMTAPYAPAHGHWMSLTGPPHLLAVERRCYDLLATMTLAEQASALAWHKGYIPGEHAGMPLERHPCA